MDDINRKVNELHDKGGIVLSPPVPTTGWEKLGFENRLASFIYLDDLPFKLIEIISRHNS